MATSAYRDGGDNLPYKSQIFQSIARHTFVSKRMRLSAPDVAFLDLCIRTALEKKKLSDLDDVQESYDEFVAHAQGHIGRHEVRDGQGKRISTLVIEPYVV